MNLVMHSFMLQLNLTLKVQISSQTIKLNPTFGGINDLQLEAMIRLRLSKFYFKMHTFPIKHGNALTFGQEIFGASTMSPKWPMNEGMHHQSLAAAEHLLGKSS